VLIVWFSLLLLAAFGGSPAKAAVAKSRIDAAIATAENCVNLLALTMVSLSFRNLAVRWLKTVGRSRARKVRENSVAWFVRVDHAKGSFEMDQKPPPRLLGRGCLFGSAHWEKRIASLHVDALVE